MADVKKRLPQNVPGEFYVDDTCIDCDACRQIAPATFRDHGDQSSVFAQPATPAGTQRALMALVACPTASIGTVSKLDARPAVAAYPENIAGNVYFCGFCAESSFGAWSYLVVRPPLDGGNILVDSPRFAAPLVRRIHELGGVATMLLSHRDDIADHAKFAAEFRCPRVMHAADGAARLGIERVLLGAEPLNVDRDIVAIPTPGHTRGHVVYLYQEKFLFTGDHLAWSPNRKTLIAFRDACWYSWPEQIRSMQRLLPFRFEWVLPGHGRITHGTSGEMHAQLEDCVAWMREAA